MPTLQFPDIVPSSISWGIRYNTQVNTSSLSGATQTIEIPAARWVATMSFSDMEAAESRILSRFITQLHGVAGRFYVYDFSHPNPVGSALTTGANVTTSSLGANMNTVNTTGWVASQGEVLKEGDYIQFSNNEVKIVTQDISSDANGNATLVFEPPLRSYPGNDTPVTFSKCKAKMMLNEDEVRWSTNNPGLLSDVTLNFIEGY